MLAIGIKGGVALDSRASTQLLLPAAFIIAMGVGLTLLGFIVLRSFVRLETVDAAAVAGHYGSVSVSTSAVAEG